MGRPRTPTKVLEARSAFKKHPERRRDGEPQVDTPLGSPPDRLNALQARAWYEIAQTAPTGVLTSADRLDVEITAVLLAKQWADPDSMTDGARKQLQTALGKYGCNPADRSRLSIEKPKLENPFAALG
jgi:hypothetical protein